MWPQIILLLWLFIAICYVANQHGNPREPYNFWALLVGMVLEVLLLWWGGFWDCFLK